MTPMDPETIVDGKQKPTEPSFSEISSANLDAVEAPDLKVQAPSTSAGAKPPGFDVETPGVIKNLFGDAIHHVIGTDQTGEKTPVESVISSGLSGLVDSRLAAIELQNQQLRDSLASMQELLQAVLTSQDKQSSTAAPAPPEVAAPAVVPAASPAPKVAPLPPVKRSSDDPEGAPPPPPPPSGPGRDAGKQREPDEPTDGEEDLKEINAKDVGKPSKYNGSAANWRPWLTKFRRFLVRRDRRWGQLLDAIANKSLEPFNLASEETMLEELGISQRAGLKFREQLYDYLEEYSECLVHSTIVDGGYKMILETFRQLCDEGYSHRDRNLRRE